MEKATIIIPKNLPKGFRIIPTLNVYQVYYDDKDGNTGGGGWIYKNHIGKKVEILEILKIGKGFTINGRIMMPAIEYILDHWKYVAPIIFFKLPKNEFNIE